MKKELKDARLEIELFTKKISNFSKGTNDVSPCSMLITNEYIFCADSDKKTIFTFSSILCTNKSTISSMKVG